jgi:hypothetical protein
LNLQVHPQKVRSFWTKNPPAMRGRKPLIPNVIPMRPDGVVDGEAREKELKREAKRKARKMMPKGLNARLQKEWIVFVG